MSAEPAQADPTSPDPLKRFPRLRQSALATFDRCALSAKFERDHERDWSNHAQARGTIFHRFAAEALREMLRQSERSIPADVALAIFHDVLSQVGTDRRCGICNAPAEFLDGRVRCENGHDHGSNLLNIPFSEVKDLRWTVIKFATDNAFDIDNLVDVEQRLFAKIRYADEDGEMVDRLLTGQLDALFIIGADADHAIVLDWKDTWMLPAPTEVGFDGYFQQRFYAWLIFRNYPTVQRVTLRELYVRRSEPREADVWRSDLESIEPELAALARRYDQAFRTGNFPPSPGHHCMMCPLPARCPIFPDARAEGALAARIKAGQPVAASEEDAQRLARELIVAKAAVKRREEALKAWANVRGPVPISDHKGVRVLGFVERSRTARPTKEALEAALRAGGPVDVDSLYAEAKQTVFTEHQVAGGDWRDDPRDGDLMAALEASLERARSGEAGDPE
jgi:PD-(D/E)XK nuclease superfamily protein